MLKLSEKEIAFLKSIIGSGISYCSSDNLTIYPSHATSLDRILMLGFKRETNHISMLFKADFFEDRDGTTFYDYTVTYKNEAGRYDNAKLILQTSPIEKITVYGRAIDWDNIENASDLRTRYNSATQTDDLFHFQCQHEQLLLVFNDFLPQAELMYSTQEIRHFFKHHLDIYRVHYEFDNNDRTT